MRTLFFFVAFLAAGAFAHAQQLILPDPSGWAQVEEGRALAFDVKLSEPVAVVKYSLEGSAGLGMTMDSTGHFSWIPDYDLVDRLTLQKEFNVIFQATLPDGKRLRHPATFKVTHVNRPPVTEELPVFYVKQGTLNTYQMNTVYVFDPDGDPIVVRPREATMPEGATLTSLGQLQWTPSRTQFNSLKNNPVTIEVIVQDQPGKLESVAKIIVKQTQLDLPPNLFLVPADSLYTIRENEVVYIKIYVADPNGEESIEQVDFVSSDVTIPRSVLKENSITQREFAWQPGYDYVDDLAGEKEVTFTFFVMDKSNNRAQRKIRIVVKDTENVELKDKVLTQKYTQSITSAYHLLMLLDQNFETLDKAYKKARKGKKNRTILNASLGAITGLSPIVLPTEQSKTVSVVGGTSVLTLNSLEAGQVIGKNAQEYQNQIKTNRDLRNQLQLKGNYFARKYALKSNRRGQEFELDRDDLARLINSDGVASLKLPAEVQKAPSSDEIRKVFPDYGEQ
ncbi:MAG: hypothetical protein JNN04_17660 [Cyclobacteriaceae bacterium]|nr:hypothetical protein [Cyclobacteriaceae bacterium]